MAMVSAACVVTAIVLMSATPSLGVPPTWGAPLVLENVHVFDAVPGTFSEPTSMLIRDGRIVEIAASVAAAPGTERLDASGRYAVPGLWDCHVHLGFLKEAGEAAVSNILAAFVRNGITSVRDVGSPLDFIAPLSQRVASAQLLGPHISFAGPLLSKPPLLGMLQQLNHKFSDVAVTVQSEADVDAILGKLEEQGATMTKAIDRWDPALFRYYLGAAAERGLHVVWDPGLPVFHHIPVDLALAMGVTSIEHAKAAWPVVLRDDLKREHDAFMASGADPNSAEDLMLRIMRLGQASVSRERLAALGDAWARSGAYFCPTLLVTENWTKEPPGVPAGGTPSQEEQKSYEGMHEVSMLFVRELAAHGVKLFVGQDGFLPRGALREMELMAQAGVRPAQILQAATINPAAWLGLDDEV